MLLLVQVLALLLFFIKVDARPLCGSNCKDNGDCLHAGCTVCLDGTCSYFQTKTKKTKNDLDVNVTNTKKIKHTKLTTSISDDDHNQHREAAKKDHLNFTFQDATTSTMAWVTVESAITGQYDIPGSSVVGGKIANPAYDNPNYYICRAPENQPSMVPGKLMYNNEQWICCFADGMQEHCVNAMYEILHTALTLKQDTVVSGVGPPTNAIVAGYWTDSTGQHPYYICIASDGDEIVPGKVICRDASVWPELCRCAWANGGTEQVIRPPYGILLDTSSSGCPSSVAAANNCDPSKRRKTPMNPK
jgi:hypothetical protein